MARKGILYCTLLILSIMILFVLNLLMGSVKIPVSDVVRILLEVGEGKGTWDFIVWESRMPQAITALFCGSALATAGLMLQTVFRNPLAGPSILGIDSGAGLGAALAMLGLGGTVVGDVLGTDGFITILVSAFTGAMLVIAVIFFFSTLIRNHVVLLIIGIMVGYMASSAITLLNFFATEEGVRSYMVWGMGTFGNVPWRLLPLFVGMISLGMLCSILMMKPLNAWLLGESYATNLGINTKLVRNGLLAISGLLSAVTTAFCGPVAFLGLSVPHMARLLLRTENHRLLLPATILMGGGVALLCNLICYLPGEQGIIPLNAVTPLVGAPIIVYVIVWHR